MAINSSIDVQNPKQTISSCFKMMHYVVPDFQREYVWEEDEIEQLLSDIEDAFDFNSEKEYFLGTTVVFDDGNKLQLIDGQQRMTTFFLILCVLAKKYKKMNDNTGAFEQLIYTATMNSEGNTVNSYTLELQYEDASECLAQIWEDKIPDSYEGLSESNKRLFEAYNIITKRLENDFEDFNDYKKFAAFFITKVVFIQIGATNMADALKIFETINQRGKILNPMDLLKNMLFMQVEQDVFSKLNEKWKHMISELEKIQEKPLRFLRYYLTSTYDISDVKQDFQGIIKEDDIYNWLLKNNDKCHYKEEPVKFTEGMIDGLKRYKEFLNPGDSVPGREYLLNIKALMGRAYKLHIVALLSANNVSDDILSLLFKAFESVIYYSVVNKIKSNTMEKIFSSWCPVIRKIKDEKDLAVFIQEKVAPTLDNWNKIYHSNFMNLSLETMQKYKIKAILARITKYVDSYRASAKDEANIMDYLKSKIEIEHIMPKKCSDIERYNAKTQDEYDYNKNLLGNLTLLEKTLNATIQNDTYLEKCKAYDNSTFYLTKSLPKLIAVGENTAINRMNEELNCWKTWDIETIEERQEMLYKLSKKVWPTFE